MKIEINQRLWGQKERKVNQHWIEIICSIITGQKTPQGFCHIMANNEMQMQPRSSSSETSHITHAGTKNMFYKVKAKISTMMNSNIYA